MREESVLAQIAELEKLPFPALKDRWRELMGTHPQGYGRRLLFRRLAHRLQELAFGGLKEEHYRMMDEVLREVRRRTRVVGAFPDGRSALMLVAARLRHIAGTKWGTKKYVDMGLIENATKAAALRG